MPSAIADPTYIGQAPHHARNIELVKRVRGIEGWMVLVAVGLEPDRRGDYRIKTVFLVAETKVERWRQSHQLLVPRR